MDYMVSGNDYDEQEKYRQAIVDYSEAIRLDPQDFAYYKRGDAYYQMKEYCQATADFDEAIRIAPDVDWQPYGSTF